MASSQGTTASGLGITAMEKKSIGILAGALAVILVSGAQIPQAGQLIKIGGIAAENGEFAFRNNVVTAYSDGDIGVIYGTGDKRSDIEAAGKSVSYEVSDQSLKRVPYDAPIALAHEFQFCDSFDQVSRPVDAAFRAVLPKDAKVKAVENYGDGRTLAIYSVPGADHYRIDFSLIEGTSGNRYSVIGSVPVSEYGDYCGMQAMTREIRAVLVDEPAGGSDFSVVYLFAVRGRKAPGK